MPFSHGYLSKVNIIVADDHPVVVMGIGKIINDFKNFNLVRTVTSIRALFESIANDPCDILICDYSFENDDEPDGLLLLRRIHRLYPNIKIILLTAHDDLVIMQQAMQIGVCGFLSKSSDDISILPTVITRVLQGEKYIDPLTSKALVKHMMSNHLSNPTLSISQLTARELEVVRMFVRGMSVTDIAQHTDRSIKTISTQKKKAMQKLGASNDIELVNIFNKLF